jgi:hypothetical protein
VVAGAGDGAGAGADGAAFIELSVGRDGEAGWETEGDCDWFEEGDDGTDTVELFVPDDDVDPLAI